MRIHDEGFIEYLVWITEERMQEIPFKRRTPWLEEWSQCLYENFQINLMAEMKKRGIH
jgi:hypothetical protein